MKRWFKGLLDKWSGIKKDYNDYYQIRKITLVDGTNKYYAEYKGSSLDNWSQIFILQKTGKGDLAQLGSSQLVTDTNYTLESEEAARELINSYKQQLLETRAKDFSSEEIIKID